MPVIRQKRSGNITKSGAITVLPKNQLKSLDNLQGTIPLDLSINGHELINTDLKFDDSSRNYVFGQNYAFGNISEGVPTEDDYYGNIISSPNTVGTSFSKNAILTKEFLKDPRQRSRLSVSYRPYKEENQIEIDEANEFYVSGTSPLISSNFQQSLLSRENIQINFDMSGDYSGTDLVSTIDGSPGGTSITSFMSYYDFVEKDFKEISGSFGENYGYFGISTEDFAASASLATIGFSPSTYLPTDEYYSGSHAEPISNFGFPFSRKFRPKNSQMLKMSNYIDKPFYLEKIIIKCNLSHFARIYQNSSGYPEPFAVTTNFFILNQRSYSGKSKINNNVDSIQTTSGSGENFVLTHSSSFSEDYYDNSFIRELVTYAKLTTATTGTIDTSNNEACQHALKKFESDSDFYAYIDNNNPGQSGQPSDASLMLPSANYYDSSLGVFASKQIQIEVPVRVARRSNNLGMLSHKKINFYCSNEFGSRTLLGKDLNKSYMNSVDTGNSLKKSYNSLLPSNKIYEVTEDYSTSSPYILYPEDNLIFGFHSLSNIFDDAIGLTVSTIITNNFMSINLIGTPVNNDKPKFEFDKRFLTSKNLRSGIIGDKFNTDIFDTLPIQLYASSSIDKIIESTGNRIIDRAVSGYYSNGNRGTHLKAVELQNSDISLTGSLLSEKAHFNYNSFGNFSDLYSQRKNTSYFKTGDNVVIYPVEKKFYDADGNKLHQTGTLSFNSDFNAKISTWFEES